MNNQSSQETFKIRSLIIYIARHILWVAVAMCIGVVLLSAVNIKKGRSLSESVKDKDTISIAELERSRSDLEVAKNNYANSQNKLEAQKVLVEEYKKNLVEFEEKYKKDIYVTANPQRTGVKTVYQFRGNSEGPIDQTINGMKNAFENLYNELAENLGNDLTPFNIQRLFAVEFNTGTNQIIIKFSFDDEASVKKAVEFYHNWMNAKHAEYIGIYPENQLTMEISDENIYDYFDNDIFNEQRNSDNNRIGIQNNILNATNAITTAQNEISTYSAKILELEDVVRKNEELRNNTVVISEENGKLVSKSSIIIYAVLGAFAGAAVSIMVICYMFMYGKKLRDAEDLEAKLGVPVLASLGTKKYKGLSSMINKIVDKVFGVDDPCNKEDKLVAAETELKLIASGYGFSKLAIVGTCDFEEQDIKTIVETCKDNLKSQGIDVMIAGNPLKQSAAVKMIADADGVIAIGQTGVSLSRDLRNIRTYLESRHVKLIGAINI